MPQLCHCVGHIVVVKLALGVDLEMLEHCVGNVLGKEDRGQYLGMNRQWYLFMVMHLVYLRAG